MNMKKKNSLIFGLGIIVGLTVSFFLNGSTVIGFPFAGSDIEKIEMYHYEGVPAEEQCKIITEQEDIDTLYKEFQNIKVRDKKKISEPMTGGSATRFIFILSNGTEYDLEYYNSGMTPSLISKAGNFVYQTSANLEKYWTKLDYDLVKKEPEMLLSMDEFWKSVTEVVYYDFNEDKFQISDITQLEELQVIFENLTYKEIENPWLEGWYMFEIHTNQNTYHLGVSGKTISFDEKFYEVSDSISENVLEIIKSESSTDELAVVGDLISEAINDEIIEAEGTETYPPKIIYEGCYFDEGVAKYWGEIPLTESPMIYCEIWISNVTETTFDFLIKEVVMATDERTIVLPLSTAKIVNNGWGAIYEGEEFTLSFEFPDDPDIFPKYITVDGWEKLEGNNYMNNKIPGHESG